MTHRQITHQFEKAELCLFHDDVTKDEVNKARFHILDALDAILDAYKAIEPRLFNNDK
jgi:hypothetical protein